MAQGTRMWKNDKSDELPLSHGERIFVNNIYTVNVRELKGTDITITHLSIKRNDRQAIRDWRHFQQIKNDICGPESCGIEFYPPESQLVDTSNQFHMWVFPSAVHFPFMFQTRLVTEVQSHGSIQRPWEEDLKPRDLLTPEQMEKHIEEYKEGVKEENKRLRGEENGKS